ncbi:MAG: hypothetical protein ACKPKO_40010, partial [Candidatus Fonsibacter sp.]
EAASAAEFTEPHPFKRPPATPPQEGPMAWPKPPPYPPWEEPVRTTVAGTPTPPQGPPPGVPRPPSVPPPGTSSLSASADVPGSTSAARGSTEATSLSDETTTSFLRRGPPKVPTGLESVLIEKHAGETDEEYKVRATSMKYMSVTGLTTL